MTKEEYYRQALVNLLEGYYPNPRTFRHEGQGKCPHGAYWFEECGNCTDDYITSVLEGGKDGVDD